MESEVTFGPILGDVRLFSPRATGRYGSTGSAVRCAVPPIQAPVGSCMPGRRGQVRCLQTADAPAWVVVASNSYGQATDDLSSAWQGRKVLLIAISRAEIRLDHTLQRSANA